MRNVPTSRISQDSWSGVDPPPSERSAEESVGELATKFTVSDCRTLMVRDRPNDSAES